MLFDNPFDERSWPRDWQRTIFFLKNWFLTSYRVVRQDSGNQIYWSLDYKNAVAHKPELKKIKPREAIELINQEERICDSCHHPVKMDTAVFLDDKVYCFNCGSHLLRNIDALPLGFSRESFDFWRKLEPYRTAIDILEQNKMILN